MLPATVYEPGAAVDTAVPTDYLAYLLAQSTDGVVFTDQAPVTVDGHTGTIFTATTDQPLDGSIGCPVAKTPADDCFGFQSDLVLRMAVIDVDGRPLVMWMRNDRDRDPDKNQDDQQSFENMLSTVRFR